MFRQVRNGEAGIIYAVWFTGIVSHLPLSLVMRESVDLDLTLDLNCLDLPEPCTCPSDESRPLIRGGLLVMLRVGFYDRNDFYGS